MWTVFLYTARIKPFRAEDRKYLLVFVDADYNAAIKLFEKEVGFNPLHRGYETSYGKTKEEVWDKALKEHMGVGGTFIPFNKIIALSQTLVIKQDLRYKNGYKATAGNT